MKKVLLIIVLIHIACIVSAQQQGNMIIIENLKVMPALLQHSDKDLTFEYAKKHDFLHTKSSIWKFDTIICYDTLMNIIGRVTQTFDNTGNVLVNLSERQQNGVWENNWQRTYTYDGNGNMLSANTGYWQNAAWNNSGRFTYTYDIDGNMLSELHEEWTGSAWGNYERHTYNYDLNGNLLTDLFEQWQSGAWVNSQKNTYTFDALNNITTNLCEKWISGAWSNYTKGTYTYDLNNKMLTDLRESWASGAWTNSLRYTYTYDLSGNMLVGFGEQWVSSSWENYSKDSNVFDVNGCKILRIRQYAQYVPFTGYTLVNSFRNTYTNDLNCNMLTDFYETWHSGTWLNFWEYYYSYDADGNSVMGKREKWQNTSWHHDLTYNLWIYSEKVPVFMIGDITCYQYNASYKSVITGISNTNTINNGLNVFPNPASETVTLNIDKKENSELSINIYNIIGTLVKSEMLKQNNRQINIGDLSDGVYMVTIKSKDLSESQKLIIQR